MLITIIGTQEAKASGIHLFDLVQLISLLNNKLVHQIISPKITIFMFLDRFKVLIIKIDAKLVIINRKKGIESIECKFCFKKILL